MINICLIEAKRCIARSWKNQSTGGISQWLKGMSFNFALEKISYFTKNKLDKFWKIWHIFFFTIIWNRMRGLGVRANPNSFFVHHVCQCIFSHLEIQ